MQPAVEPSQHVDVPGPFEAPIAPDEPADSGDVVIGPDEVVLDGTRIDSTSTLEVLRTACRSSLDFTSWFTCSAFQASCLSLEASRDVSSPLCEAQPVQGAPTSCEPAWNP